VRRAKAVPPLKKVIAALQLLAAKPKGPPKVRMLASKAPISQLPPVGKGRTKPAPRPWHRCRLQWSRLGILSRAWAAGQHRGTQGRAAVGAQRPKPDVRADRHQDVGRLGEAAAVRRALVVVAQVEAIVDDRAGALQRAARRSARTAMRAARNGHVWMSCLRGTLAPLFFSYTLLYQQSKLGHVCAQYGK